MQKSRRSASGPAPVYLRSIDETAGSRFLADQALYSAGVLLGPSLISVVQDHSGCTTDCIHDHECSLLRLSKPEVDAAKRKHFSPSFVFPGPFESLAQ